MVNPRILRIRFRKDPNFWRGVRVENACVVVPLGPVLAYVVSVLCCRA
jgi:hypothetical protein